MARFNVRVELKGEPSWSIYEQLHTLMGEANYSRTITSSDGTSYNLPHAEYVVTTDWSIDAILQEVWKIAKSVWSDPAVYVTSAGPRKWLGLDPV